MSEFRKKPEIVIFAGPNGSGYDTKYFQEQGCGVDTVDDFAG